MKLAAPPGFQMPEPQQFGPRAVPRGEESLETTYFDTMDLRLARWGVSLRYREGRGWTVKLPPELSGEVVVRQEYVFLGDASEPPAEAIDLLCAYVRSATLRPVVRLATIRAGIDLLSSDGNREAEILEDQVAVISDGITVSRFRELEVELAEEAPGELFDQIVGVLRAAGAGSSHQGSKYLRALAGAGSGPPEVTPTEVGPGATAGQVVQAAIAKSVARLLRFDAVVRLDTDIEGVHQARVATRRLRSDLRTFRPLLDEEWSAALRERLAELADSLGAVRDSDVLLERMTKRVTTLPGSEEPGGARVVDALEHRNKEVHAELMEVLHGEDYVTLLDDLVAAAADPALVSPAADPASEVIPTLVEHPWKALRSAVKEAGDDPPDEQLHQIRILVKRARYAAEAAIPAAGKPATRFAEAAADLQTVLGDHQDACVAEDWLRGFARDSDSTDIAFAAGMLAGMERDAAEESRSHWLREWKRLDRRKLREWIK